MRSSSCCNSSDAQQHPAQASMLSVCRCACSTLTRRCKACWRRTRHSSSRKQQQHQQEYGTSWRIGEAAVVWLCVARLARFALPGCTHGCALRRTCNQGTFTCSGCCTLRCWQTCSVKCPCLPVNDHACFACCWCCLQCSASAASLLHCAAAGLVWSSTSGQR